MTKTFKALKKKNTKTLALENNFNGKNWVAAIQSADVSVYRT
jgi:hypothetical protein